MRATRCAAGSGPARSATAAVAATNAARHRSTGAPSSARAMPSSSAGACSTGPRARSTATSRGSRTPTPICWRGSSRFLRRSFDVPDEKIAFSVNCFLGNGLSLAEIEDWWLTRLALPPASLRKAAVNRASSASAGRRGHTLPYGTGRVTVCSTFIVQSIYGAIQEYAAIDRPEWIDL